MERLAILDHLTHELFVEDVTEEMLEPYGGNEEDYLKHEYAFEDGEFSWDYITRAYYYPENRIPQPIDFND